MRRLGHVPALDGIRGVAILLVIGRHYWHLPKGGGTAGVDLFFVLSGFLITTLLLEGRWPTLRAFYVARARRLLPALAVVLAAYLTGAAATGSLNYALKAVAATGFYTADLVAAFWPHTPTTPIPLWSLALEEQFYLVWPILLILLIRRRARRERIIAGLLLAVIATSVWRAWLFAHGAPNQRIYAAPDSHSDNLMMGILLAYWRPAATDPGLAGMAVLMFGIAAVSGIGGELIVGPLVNVAGLALIAYAASGRSWLATALGWRPLVWVGGISYSLYLWHLLTLSWIPDKPAAVAVAFGAAWLSTRYVERPFRGRRSARLERAESPSAASLERGLVAVRVRPDQHIPDVIG